VARVENVSTESDLGPIVYLASVFGTTVDKAVGSMILALTLCFDPFALFLTVLINRPRHTKTVESIKTVEEVHPPIHPTTTKPKRIRKKSQKVTPEKVVEKEVKVFIKDDLIDTAKAISEARVPNNPTANNFNLTAP
jgi:superfamily I DNA and RNA helicase